MTTKYLLKEKTNTPTVSSICSPKCNDFEKANTCLSREVQALRAYLQLPKHDFCLKETELNYNLKVEQTKTQQFEQALNKHIKSLQHDIEVKQQIINTTKSSLDSLKQDIERAQDEILSLKSHIGSLSSKTDTQFKEPTNRHKTKDASMERKSNSLQKP